MVKMNALSCLQGVNMYLFSAIYVSQANKAALGSIKLGWHLHY